MVQATYICGSAVILEALLSFLGAGTPPEIPSWGNMIPEGRVYFQFKSWLILFPGVCLAIMVLTVNILGDGLREHLTHELRVVCAKWNRLDNATDYNTVNSSNPVLSIRDLRTYFDTRDGTVRAVDGVSLDVFPSETVCIVGESGCGKSVTAMTILGLLPKPPARIESGEILFDGVDLLKLSEQEMQEIRGNDISMIFQEPMTSLNPVLTVGEQIRRQFLSTKKYRGE
ncbi:MAG: hypothetical protein CM1200mP39_25080 [Dehalococcoidia bacterium]|nr:MAG: hypothetical protein CM1200mP39_25080 [Dehalococcoidia bacterium]